MQSQTLRATHYSELNDWKEVTMGAEIIERSLKAHVPSIEPETKEVLADYVDAFRGGELDIFLFSLSKEKDSLSQWIAYCREGGVAIGFAMEGLPVHFQEASQREMANERKSPTLWRGTDCRYLRPGKLIDVGEIVSIADQISNIKKMTEESKRKWMDPVSRAYLYHKFQRTCCSIKHDAYASENEWRVFYTWEGSNPPEIKFDDRNRRFVELQFKASDVIREVWISPHGDQRQGMTLARYFKDSMNLSYKIKKSKIPFRIL